MFESQSLFDGGVVWRGWSGRVRCRTVAEISMEV